MFVLRFPPPPFLSLAACALRCVSVTSRERLDVAEGRDRRGYLWKGRGVIAISCCHTTHFVFFFLSYSRSLLCMDWNGKVLFGLHYKGPTWCDRGIARAGRCWVSSCRTAKNRTRLSTLVHHQRSAMMQATLAAVASASLLLWVRDHGRQHGVPLFVSKCAFSSLSGITMLCS